jgi:hypothetical protein
MVKEVNNTMCEKSIEDSSDNQKAVRRKILVIGNEDKFSEEVMDYTVHLAERLDYDILALNVSPTVWNGEAFKQRAMASAKALKHKALQRGIRSEHVVKFGDLGASVEELNLQTKRIEFVITDSGVNREEVGREVTVPLFSVVSNTIGNQGGTNMADDHGIQKKKPLGKTIGYGMLTIGMYAAVFTNADTVMQYFTRGGVYAALPIATVFLFSFAHGAFAGNLWSLMGIEAMKKDALRQTEQKVATKREQAKKKKPRAYAYVNPFHRI